MEIVTLIVVFVRLMRVHLLLKFILQLLLVLSQLVLNGVFFLLELVHVVHDDFGPIVLILGVWTAPLRRTLHYLTANCLYLR